MVLLLMAAVTLATSGGDLTLQAGTTGAAVVEAVTDRLEASCVFPEDKMFLRRIAYVETFDGVDSDTYREGYHGGIWQVSYVKYHGGIW